MGGAASFSCLTPGANTEPKFRIGRHVTEIDARRKLMRRFVIGLMVAAMAAIGFGGVGALADPSSNWQLADGSAQGSGGIASFDFSVPDKTHLLYNSKDSLLLGDLSTSTMTATFTESGVSAGATFTYGGEGTASNPCGSPATVRLFFESIPPGTKFAFTNYWWSNPVGVNLADLAGAMSVSVADPSQWSDWDGHMANFSPEVTAAFHAAASNVTLVGLSFGGGCFFENGVGTSDGSGTFTLNAFSS